MASTHVFRPFRALRSSRPLRATGLLLVVAGAMSCGSDDAPATSAATDTRVDVVVAAMERDAAEFGFTLDRACLAGLLGQLSDADLDLLVASAPDTSPDATTPALSPAGEALGEEVNGCITPGEAAANPADPAVVEEAVQYVMEEEATADEECLRRNFGRLSDEQLQLMMSEGPASDDPALGDVFAAVLPCLD